MGVTNDNKRILTVTQATSLLMIWSCHSADKSKTDPTVINLIRKALKEGVACPDAVMPVPKGLQKAVDKVVSTIGAATGKWYPLDTYAGLRFNPELVAAVDDL